MNVIEKTRAILVLQRFVKMSRFLLPRFSVLVAKKNLSEAEQIKINRIQNVYDNIHFNPAYSKKMINSNILDLIIEVYQATNKKGGYSPKTFHAYNSFIKESDRLIAVWEKQKLN
jgi:hypothetical protein